MTFMFENLDGYRRAHRLALARRPPPQAQEVYDLRGLDGGICPECGPESTDGSDY